MSANPLGLDLAGSVEGDRFQGRIFRARHFRLADAVATVGNWHEDFLRWRRQFAKQSLCIPVDGECTDSVAITDWCAHQGSEWNGCVVGFKKIGDKALIAAITAHNIEKFRCASIG